jgi:hypothetical protein
LLVAGTLFKSFSYEFQKNSQINIWLFLRLFECAPIGLRADFRGRSANTPEFGIRAMSDGIFTNPAFIDRFIRALVSGIRRESDSLRGVIDASMDGIHAEGQQVAGFKL